MKRVLLIAATTGYQTRAFGGAAADLGVELVFATDRCHQLDDPWRDGALPIRFHDEAGFLDLIDRRLSARPVDGVLGLGDRPAVLAALAAERLGLPGHPTTAARASASKLETRQRLAAAGLPCPVFKVVALDGEDGAEPPIDFPCVVKPLALAASRGVVRADDPAGLRAALDRVRRLLSRDELRERRDPSDRMVLVERFVPGREYAVEGLVDAGVLRSLAIFDKPDPLDGPFFEESIYVTPSRAAPDVQRQILRGIGDAVAALGLSAGPVHAECRVNGDGVWVLEVAARPIGGLCSRALRFEASSVPDASLEALLLRWATGGAVGDYRRESAASAVMMMPIPRGGIFNRVDRVEEARAEPGVVDLVVTAKPGQRLEPPPEGGSYLGFIFAKGRTPVAAETAVRDAYRRLEIVIDAPLPVL